MEIGEGSEQGERLDVGSSLRRLTLGVAQNLAVVAVLALLAIYWKLDSGNPVAFRILVGAAVLGLFFASVNVLLFARWQGQARSLAKLSQQAMLSTTASVSHLQTAVAVTQSTVSNIERNITEIRSGLHRLDWSYDAAEHESAVYTRMAEMVRNPLAASFKIVSVWRDPRGNDPRPIDTIRVYYDAIETRLVNTDGFNYERLAILKGTGNVTPQPIDLLSGLMRARPEFASHCGKVILETIPFQPNSRADMRFFKDAGRLLDVAFGITLDRAGVPLQLVLEIGTTGPITEVGAIERPALGLLSIVNPDPRLAESFMRAHEALRRSNAANVEPVASAAVREYLVGGIR